MCRARRRIDSVPAHGSQLTNMSKAIQSWKEEQGAAYLYRILSEIETGTLRQRLFSELAHEAEEQSGIWAQSARRHNTPVPAIYRPDIRTRLVGKLTRVFGPRS